MVLVMQSEKRGVKIDPTLVIQGLIYNQSIFVIAVETNISRGIRGAYLWS